MIRSMTPHLAAVLAALAAGGTTQTAMAQAAWVAPIEHCRTTATGCEIDPTDFDWPLTLMQIIPDGGVVTAARVGDQGAHEFGGVVVKRDVPTGRELWRYTRTGDSFSTDYFRDIASFANGDIVLTSFPELAVRLDGATGLPRWTAARPAGFDVSGDISVDAAGNVAVLVMGPALGTAPYTSPVVVIKLDGSTGQELWRSTQPNAYGDVTPRSFVQPLPNGDLIVTSWTSTSFTDWHRYIVRLRGTDGAEQWRTEFDQAVPQAGVTEIALTSEGDIIVVGRRLDPGWAMRVRGTDGVVQWSKDFPDYWQVHRVLVNPDDDIILAGYGPESTSLLTRVSGVDGATQWTRALATDLAHDGFQTIARAPDGTLLASGECYEGETLCILGFNPETGADRWSFSRPLSPDDWPVYARDLQFDARGNLLVNAKAESRTVAGRMTAAQWRIVGPWADDLFSNGFD